MRYSWLLLIALLFLTGCSMESDPVTKPKAPDAIKLDKLEAESKASVKPPESVPTPPLASPTPSPASPKPMPKQYSSPPAFSLNPKHQYSATIHTSRGDIVIALDAQATPKTVNNFVFLARDKFYDQTIFHRIISGFMIQGGDPEGSGAGGPGYRFADEEFTGEYTRGTVAMANAGPDTNGSQFFIMHADYTLPKKYVIFGHVVSGLDVVDAIATATTKPGGEGSTPVDPTVVKTIQITEK